MRPSRRHLGGLALILALTACGSPVPPGGEPSPEAEAAGRPAKAHDLRPGERVSRQLAGGECTDFRIQLAEGRFFRFRVAQRQLDVATTLLDPRGDPLAGFDSPTADRGEEGGAWVARETGEHRLQVCASPDASGDGGFELWMEAPVVPGSTEQAEAAAYRSYNEGRRLANGGHHAEARAAFEKAAGLWQRAGDHRGVGWAVEKLGDLAEREGDPERARELRLRAAEAYRRAGETISEAWASYLAGDLARESGRLREALADYQRSARRAEAAGAATIRLLARSGVGVAAADLGRLEQALESHREVLEEHRRRGDLHRQWESLRSLGAVYLGARDPELAYGHFQDALTLARELGDLEKQAETLEYLGRADWLAGRNDEAREHFLQALRLRRGHGDALAIASALNNLGRAEWRSGRPERATVAYQEALQIARAAGDPDLEATVLVNLARVHNEAGRLEEALEACSTALDLFRRLGRSTGVASAYHCLAHNEEGRGRKREALGHIEAALERVERFRSSSARQDLRAAYLASRQDYYELWVDLLMRLDAEEPGAGWARRAWDAAERARSRVLLDALVETGVDLEARADPELLHRLAEAADAIAAADAAWWRAEHHGATEEELEALAARRRRRLEEQDQLRALLRRRHPAWAELRDPQPVVLGEIQASLGPETQVLSYFLGERRSFVWLAGESSLIVYPLPPRREIETLARSTHEALSGRGLVNTDRAEHRLAELSARILAPVAAQLRSRRLVVIPDGALHYVPFAALPWAGDGDRTEGGAPRLIDRFEVVTCPSASASVLLRQRLARREPAAKTLAVLADPVFSSADERLPGNRRRVAVPPKMAPPTALSRAASDVGLAKLDRLRYTGEEAEAVIALVGAEERLVLLGFEATRRRVLEGDLATFRYLHFATHGVLHPTQPRLSGIVLSQRDQAGGEIEGFLRANEIYDLVLAADLVVLSACRTGLGKEVRGEGVLGLTRAFLHAGAGGVIFSLWDVDDRATFELMKRFYEALLKEGCPPAEALRRGQLSLARETRWSSPHFWAGFVLQGEERQAGE